MNTVPKHDFLPEAPDGRFKTVWLRDLALALLTKRLHSIIPKPRKKISKSWWDGHYWPVRQRRHPIVVKADQWCKSEILHDLQEGGLIAFTKLSGIFYRIPSAFWYEQFVGLALDGNLFDVVEGETFPKEFWGCSIFIFDKSARPWLLQRQIDEDNLAFPDSLRTRRFTPTKPLPSEERIAAQLTAMKARGIGRDEAAILIRSVPGFENVGNDHARRAAKGKFGRGRPRKTTLEK